MTVDFKPQNDTGPIASRWLMKSGMLSKAEQLVLDTWMSRTSRDMKNTLNRECLRLYEMGVFEDMPNLKIIPQIETIAQSGSRKFLEWADKFSDAIPEVVRSGFKSVYAASAGPVGAAKAFLDKLKPEDPFGELFDSPEESFSSSFRYTSKIEERDGLLWEKPILHAAQLMLEAPDLKKPLYAGFPSMEEAVMFTLHHEAAHGSLAARQDFNPILSRVKHAPNSSDEHRRMNASWVDRAWAALLSVHPPEDNKALADVAEFQTLSSEYYCDTSAALMHARHGYTTEYLEPLCQARANGSDNHRTTPVLRELGQVLDFHPIVLNHKIDAFDLHMAVGKLISPQMSRDILNLVASSPAIGMFFEKALAPFPMEEQSSNAAYQDINEALAGGEYPKLAMFLSKLEDGPDVAAVRQAFSPSVEPMQAGPSFG